MGEIAEMMIDGTLCEGCGGFIDDSGGDGFPRRCSFCKEDRSAERSKRCLIALEKLRSSGFKPQIHSAINSHIKVGDWNFYAWTGKIYNPKIKTELRGIANFIKLLKQNAYTSHTTTT